jgi:hypothetical protein
MYVQIIDNPEIDRSNELGAALNEKMISSEDSLGVGDFGLSMGALVGSNLSNDGMTSIANSNGSLLGGGGGGSVIAGGLHHGGLSQPGPTSSILSGMGSGGNRILLNPSSGNLGSGHNVSSSLLGNGSVGSHGTDMGSIPHQISRGESVDMFPLESYQPSNLKTVFPRDMISDEGAGLDGYGFGGSLGLVDVSWNDNADPCTGMMLYRGEHYEWLASHAAVVRGGGNPLGNCGDIMDGGPINDGIRSRQQNRISVDSSLCPILPSIDVTDVTKLTKPDLLMSIDSDAFGPFDTDECRAGITIW